MELDQEIAALAFGYRHALAPDAENFAVNLAVKVKNMAFDLCFWNGEHRPDAEPGGLQLAEAGLDDPHALVAERDVGGRERVVVGGQHELAVEALRRLDLGRVDPGPALVIEREIGAERLEATWRQAAVG